MINPLGTSHWVNGEINDAGYDVVDKSGLLVGTRLDGAPFLQADEDAVNAIIASHDQLPYAKAQKIQEIKEEAVPRAQAFLDFINTFDALLYNREVFMSIVPGAISLTTNMQGVKDVTTAGVDARDSVNALGSVGAVEAYDVVNDPAWP